MSTTELEASKRELLALSQAALRVQVGSGVRAVAAVDDARRRLKEARSPDEVAALRDELQRLEDQMLAAVDAIARRLDAERRPRAWRFTMHRDPTGELEEIVAVALENR